MNYLVLAMIVLTILPIIVGFLLGLIRGIKRSVARAITIVVCVLLAGLLCGVVSNAVMNINTGDGTVSDLFSQMLEEAFGELDFGSILIPFVQAIIKVYVFLILFYVLQFLTWIIVTPICAAIFRHGEKKKEAQKGKKIKKHRLFGSLIGAVQGLAVALVIGMVFSGVFVQFGKVTALAGNIVDSVTDSSQSEQESDSESETAPGGEILQLFTGYNESGVAKFYQALTGKPFEWLTTVETDDGKISLPELVDSFASIGKMAEQIGKLTDVDFAALMDSGDFGDLQSILEELDNINGEMSDRSKQVINQLLDSMSEAFDLPIDLSELDFTSIEFAKEGEIMQDLYDYSQNPELTEDDAKDIVKKLGESQLLLPAVESADVDLAGSLSSEQMEFVESAIDELEGDPSFSQSKIESLRRIFGLA